MDKLIRKLNPRNVDEVTLGEIERFIELKLDEHMKFRGQIARDMRRLGQDAFRDPSAYQLARLVAEEYGKKYSLKAINEIIDSAFYHIGCALIQSSAPNQSNTVRIQNFGTFEVKERAPRKCINPRTGKEMELPAIKRVTFRQSKPLKDALNQ